MNNQQRSLLRYMAHGNGTSPLRRADRVSLSLSDAKPTPLVVWDGQRWTLTAAGWQEASRLTQLPATYRPTYVVL